MKIFSAKDDIITENFVIIQDDVVAVLDENDNSVTLNVKKESGFDFKDADYTLTIDKKVFEQNFESIDNLNEDDLSEKTNTESELGEDEIEQDYVDPKVKKDEKNMITQEIDRIEKLLQQNEKEENIYQECSTKVKQNVEKRIGDLKPVREQEEIDLTESINEQIDRFMSLVENKTITKTMKSKVKTIIETFLQEQVKALSATFDDRLKYKVMEIERSKEKEINDFIIKEKKRIDEYVDYVSRQIMMEMKDSFVDEEITKESLKYKDDLKKLQENFKRLNKSYITLQEDNTKLQNTHTNNLTTISTLKESNDKLKTKVNLLIKHGLIRDITESVDNEDIKLRIEEKAKTLPVKNFEQFYNDLKKEAIGILKEDVKKEKTDKKIKKQQLIEKIQEKFIKEEKDSALLTDSTPIFEKEKTKTADDLYTGMLN